ncbi:MAG: hypothetical protein BA863_07655 [Desulfovibrio sp. S3730MH75]|nr:MAG: hypothetical protein BA863_07655 [Desulfovibrio sp. S3730MH75]
MEVIKVGKDKNARRSSADLLDAGLELLAEHTVQQLTIDALCNQLNVTKGSFYHHFKGRADYLERMLAHWVEVWTIGSMNQADAVSKTAVERFDAIVDKSNNLPHGPETSIRSWAQRDALAQSYLEKVDSIRINYLFEIFNEVSGDADRAFLLARISYSLFVGTRMIVPAILGDDRDRVIKLMKEELYGM